MALSVVNSWQNRGAGTTVEVTTSGISAGDLLVAVFTTFETTGSAGIATPTDNGSNSWTVRNETVADATYRDAVGIADCIVSTPPTSVTLTGDAGVDNIGGAVLLIRGHDTSPYDTSDINEQTSASPVSQSITNTIADSIFVAGSSHAGATTTLTEEGGWTLAQEQEDSASGVPFSVVYRIVSSAASRSHTWTAGASRTFATVIATYRQASPSLSADFYALPKPRP